MEQLNYRKRQIERNATVSVEFTLTDGRSDLSLSTCCVTNQFCDLGKLYNFSKPRFLHLLNRGSPGYKDKMKQYKIPDAQRHWMKYGFCKCLARKQMDHLSVLFTLQLFFLDSWDTQGLQRPKQRSLKGVSFKKDVQKLLWPEG